jgi:hypothetical protein
MPALRPGPVKSLLRAGFESRLGDSVRYAVARHHSRGDAALVANWSSRLGIAGLNVYRLAERFDPAQTLFILGSGESVETFQHNHWDEIAQHTSIGVNAWPLHPFVADIYAFEPFDPQSTDYVQLYSDVLHEQRFSEKAPTILLFRPHSDLDAERYSLMPENLQKDALLYGRIVPQTHVRANLLRDISIIHRHHRSGGINSALVMDLGATIIRMVSLGYLLGYRKIVLAGVDLNGGEYFWQKNPQHLVDRGINSFSPGHNRAVHETMTRDVKAFILTEVLEEFQKLFTQAGGSIFTASGESTLASFLPTYPWRQPEQ